MKLGIQTNSVVNYLSAHQVGPTPEVGMGATMLGWSDRHAGTVIGWDGKILTVQRDHARRCDKLGMTDAQDYTYEADPKGSVTYFKLDRTGKWRSCSKSEKGRWILGETGLRLGVRDEYYDFTF
jgi:hypothetical protein